MRALSSLLLLALLGGCADGSGDCPYSVDDACINEDNLAECEQRSEQCPGRVLVLESCPLQFSCS